MTLAPLAIYLIHCATDPLASATGQKHSSISLYYVIASLINLFESEWNQCYSISPRYTVPNRALGMKAVQIPYSIQTCQESD
jgi:hypothetical protein